MRVAEAAGPLARHEIVTRHVREPGDLSVEQGNINRLTSPGTDPGQQRRLDGVGGK